MIEPLNFNLPTYKTIIANATLENTEDSSISSEVKILRESALERLFAKIKFLIEKTNMMPVLFSNIANKKCGFIKSATTQNEVEEILQWSKSKYNGNKLAPVSPYHVEAEELVLLSYNTETNVPSDLEVDRMTLLLDQLMKERKEVDE